MTVPSLETLRDWPPETLIAYLEADGEPAPEYDLEANGIALLRRDCAEKAQRERTQASRSTQTAA